MASNMPSKLRILAAFLFAPALAALALAIVQEGYDGPRPAWELLETTLFFAGFGAYPAIILFGVPAYLILRGRIAPTLLNCVIAGAVTAALPWILYSMVALAGTGGTTNYGWLGFIGIVAGFGALGGLIFWLIASGGGTYPKTTRSEEAH